MEKTNTEEKRVWAVSSITMIENIRKYDHETTNSNKEIPKNQNRKHRSQRRGGIGT